jgi:membrane associated rhomboid family serine protease
MASCYRHPGRETGVSCSNCGRPICPDCMTPTPVGMRCPECSRQRTAVRNLASPASGDVVTRGLIAVNVLAFLGELVTGSNGYRAGGSLYEKWALFGPSVADGDWWRLITSGFLHSGLIHIGFNMYLLFLLGRLLEPTLGSVRFAAVYFVSLLGGSLGALIVNPHAVTVGASGAVFGLMGAAAIQIYRRGQNPLQSDIGMLIILNLVISFVLPGISIGGHIGGLVAGGLCALVLDAPPLRRSLPAAVGALVALGVAIAVTAVAVAPSSVL